MRNLFCLAVFLFSALITFSQVENEEEAMQIGAPALNLNSSKVYGKVMDGRTEKGIDAASVQIYTTVFNKETGNKTDKMIGGMLTHPNGDFSFENMDFPDSFRLVISAIGYEAITIPVVLGEEGENRFERSAVEKDVGNVFLVSDVQNLGTVTIVAEKPALEMGIDRKIFNADKSLVSTGGTAIDLIKNIPSVTVDVDGNVELRNNTPQIYVDGRPTILTLDQIPADNIEKVELITNPSAKFDASSAGGIINIVLKKNKRLGLNGLASIGAGSPERLNGNLNLNLRQGKFNFFATGSYNRSGGEAKSKTNRTNFVNGEADNYFNQLTVNDRTRRFIHARFGIDYFADNRNTLSIVQSIVRGKFVNDEEQNQEYLTKEKLIDQYGERFSRDNFRFKRNRTQLVYKHNFPQEGKEISADFNYNYGSRNGATSILNTFYYPDGNINGDPNRVNNYASGGNDQVTFQVDYTSSGGDSMKFEAGGRVFIDNFNSNFNAFSLDNGGLATKLPLSNNYKYRESIYAGYLTYANKWNGFIYQLGLRTEFSKFDGELPDSARKFGYQFPDKLSGIWNALFPSLFITRKISENDELQVNYTRRIRRPRFWNLNPFIDITDPVNLRQGNPELQPEFINSFEFNYSKNYNGGNLLAVLYWRNNPRDITQYSDTISAEKYQQLNNAAISPNAILNTFINAKGTNRYGAEFTLQHKFSNNFDVTPTVDFQYRKVKASVNNLNLSNEGFNWEGKLIINYKLQTPGSVVFNDLGFQVVGEYESPRVIPQGKRTAEYSADFAIRKDLFKNNKGTITFSVNDVFNSLKFGTIYDTETFYQESYRRRRVRSFGLTFSYKFGDAEFNMFGRNGNRRQSTGGEGRDD